MFAAEVVSFVVAAVITLEPFCRATERIREVYLLKYFGEDLLSTRERQDLGRHICPDCF